MTFHHGVRVTEVSTGARAIRTVSTSVIGLIAHSTDADAGVFPLGAAALITDVRAAIAKAGVVGTLAKALSAIADQCSPIVVVVRVAPGADDEDLEDNAVAGVALLASAESALKVKPRILGAPGIDTAPVAAALAAMAAKLRGFAYVSDDGAATVADAIEYRETFAQREVMVIHGDFKNGANVVPAVAVALGTRARIDNEQGVQKTLSNVPVLGVTGVTIPVSFDLQDPATDAGLLNADEVTALIHTNGYRFWGNRTCAEDPIFAFESTVRVSQVVRDTIAEGMAWAMDKDLHPSLGRDIIETINAKGRELQSAGVVLGLKAWIDPTDNTATALAGGILKIRYKFTVPPPLEDLELVQEITDEYLASFVDQVNAG